MSRFDMLVGEVVIVLAMAVLWGCGSGGGGYDPAPTPPGGDDKAWTDTIQPLVAKNCNTCHGVKPNIPVFANSAAFKSSKAKSELQTGGMPLPPKVITAADRDALLAYLGG